jgi:hypothetical protein
MRKQIFSVWVEADPEPGYEWGILYYCGDPCPLEGDYEHQLFMGNALSGIVLTNSNVSFIVQGISYRIQKLHPSALRVDVSELK